MFGVFTVTVAWHLNRRIEDGWCSTGTLANAHIGGVYSFMFGMFYLLTFLVFVCPSSWRTVPGMFWLMKVCEIHQDSTCTQIAIWMAVCLVIVSVIVSRYQRRKQTI